MLTHSLLHFKMAMIPKLVKRELRFVSIHTLFSFFLFLFHYPPPETKFSKSCTFFVVIRRTKAKNCNRSCTCQKSQDPLAGNYSSFFLFPISFSFPFLDIEFKFKFRMKQLLHWIVKVKRLCKKHLIEPKKGDLRSSLPIDCPPSRMLITSP